MKNTGYFPLVIFLFLLPLVYACSQNKTFQKPKLITENGHNYLVQDSLLIPTQNGGEISVIVVRKKSQLNPESTVLLHNIYARSTDLQKAYKIANRGFVAVLSYTRGKVLSKNTITPYKYEAIDTYAVIDWISKQPWSNKKVGMYGGSYCGFVQWASVKHKVHPALKTIVPSAATAPGVAEPMENGVIPNFFYPWPHYVTNNKYLDTTLYNNNNRWYNLNKKWYATGAAYQALDSLDGLPNPLFNEWLNHPTFDPYWQRLLPYKSDFSHINIPVLSTTGYYDGGQIGTLYYLKQHYAYNPKAEHYLLIGPYTHFGCQAKPKAQISEYNIDPVAQIDITNLIFDWFDYILKDGQKPDILKDKINYQVMGSNTWQHAPSLSKMATDTLTYYFSNLRSKVKFESTYNSGNLGQNEHFSLTQTPLSSITYLEQTIDFSDRGNYTWNSSGNGNIVSKTLTIGEGFSFATPPFKTPLEINGAFLGNLEIGINKKDFDCTIQWFEQKENGEFHSLSLPYVGRASHANNPEQRQLLTPNTKTSFPFTNVRMTSKKLAKGSRLVVVINGIKHPFSQINYGSGKPVSQETLKDAQDPLIIKWYTDSYIKIPIKNK